MVVGGVNGYHLSEVQLGTYIKSLLKKKCMSTSPAILLVDKYVSKGDKYGNTQLFMGSRVFTRTLFVTVTIWKQAKSPNTDD